jgi:hypothetical protein
MFGLGHSAGTSRSVNGDRVGANPGQRGTISLQIDYVGNSDFYLWNPGACMCPLDLWIPEMFWKKEEGPPPHDLKNKGEGGNRKGMSSETSSASWGGALLCTMYCTVDPLDNWTGAQNLTCTIYVNLLSSKPICFPTHLSPLSPHL